MEVLKIGDKIIFQGELEGTIVKSGSSGGVFSSSSAKIKLDVPIKDVPDVIIAKSRHFAEFPFGEGDKVRVNGKIIKKDIVFWNNSYYILSCDHLWNETQGMGW